MSAPDTQPRYRFCRHTNYWVLQSSLKFLQQGWPYIVRCAAPPPQIWIEPPARLFYRLLEMALEVRAQS